MPTPEQLRLKIAEVLGWKFDPRIPNIDLSYNSWTDPEGKQHPGKYDVLPNWPTDRNASYGLPVEDEAKYVTCRERGRDNIITLKPMSAYQESLTWLIYKGWRWETCAGCIDRGKPSIKEVEPMYPSAKGEIMKIYCNHCHGEDGEWVKA